MDLTDRVVNSGGGAVFQSDVTAGRDITINHFTEIRQVTERLSGRCSQADTSDKLLGSLEALSAVAEYTEDWAKELNADVFSNDPLLERISRECAYILSELKRLENSLECNRDGSHFFTASPDESVVDMRSRLMSLQMHLSNINNRKTAKDFEIIKEAVAQLMSSHENSDEASSFRSFYTASSIPFVERQMWQDIQKALRARLKPNVVRDNYALIVTLVEKIIVEDASRWIVEGAKSDDSPSRVSNTTITGATLRVSETYNIAMSYMEDGTSEIEQGADEDASLHPLYESKTILDRSGVTWSRLVSDGNGECLLALDGGGVKSYSSLLTIKALMEEVIACENRFEQQFTHYPRTFNVSDFRPCHYFHKMYGTSTGGILAIALSRLRMTVAETIVAFGSTLDAMYTSRRNLVPLATKYKHSHLEAALLSMVQQYCKQHEKGFCNGEEKFQWHSTGMDTPYRAHRNRDDWNEWDDWDDWQERNASKPIPPEEHLCQTVCLAAVATGQVNEPYLLRTYNHRYDPYVAPPWVRSYNTNTLDLYTWQVGRATTAAPSLFKMLVATGPEGSLSLKDGGIRENNPSYCAYSESCSLWGDDQDPTLLLSIGAGHTSSSRSSEITPFGLSALSKYAKKRDVFRDVRIRYTEGQNTHKTMRIIASGEFRWYKRFEVTHGLDKIEVDEWEPEKLSSARTGLPNAGGRTLEKISTATDIYLSREMPDISALEYAAPGQMLKQTAEKLVRMRRARELEAMTQGGKKQEQWEAFMGKHLPGEREFFRKYQEGWDYALLGRKY